MGAIVKVFCESCSAAWDCHTGCGIQHGSMENVAPLFPEAIENILMDYAEHSEYPLFDFAFQPAVCANCTSIVSVPVLRLHENGTTYIGVCPDCGKKVKPQKERQKLQCPICKKSMLKTLETGRWD